MVKCTPSARNKKLSVIKQGFEGKGPFAAEIQQCFPTTSFICNPIGTPICYEGEYDVEKHREAYERAKKWMPVLRNDKLFWDQSPYMKPFRRLFDAKPNLKVKTKRARVKSTHRTLWSNGLPPIQVGMIGEYKGHTAIVAAKSFKTTKRRRKVGIGDEGNVFYRLEDANVQMLGVYTDEELKPSWVVHTKEGQHEVYNNSRVFTRKNVIIKDFDPTIHLEKYLK